MLLVLLVVVLSLAVAAALASRPFGPTRSLFPLRLLVTAVAATAGVMLAVSVTHDWWVAEGWEGATDQVAGGGHVVARWVVVAGLLSCVVTVAATWGRRNWAPVGLVVTWLGVGVAWFEASGQVTGAPTDARFGLRLATWAVVLVTFGATLGSVGRWAER